MHEYKFLWSQMIKFRAPQGFFSVLFALQGKHHLKDLQHTFSKSIYIEFEVSGKAICQLNPVGTKSFIK